MRPVDLYFAAAILKGAPDYLTQWMRQHPGVSPTEVETLTGITRRHIRNMTNGHRALRVGTARKLLEWLATDPRHAVHVRQAHRLAADCLDALPGLVHDLYRTHGRPAGVSKGGLLKWFTPEGTQDAHARVWATANGYDVLEVGRVSGQLLAAYAAAGRPVAETIGRGTDHGNGMLSTGLVLMRWAAGLLEAQTGVTSDPLQGSPVTPYRGHQ